MRRSPGAIFSRSPWMAAGAARCRTRDLDQRHIGGGAVGVEGLLAELRMTRDALCVPQLRLPLRVESDQLVIGAGRHAMRCGQHQVARDRDAGTGIAAQADDHHRRVRALPQARRPGQWRGRKHEKREEGEDCGT